MIDAGERLRYDCEVRDLTPKDIAMVESVARRMAQRSRLPWEELQSLGWLGLLRAAKSFDPSRGVPFEVWAEKKIAGEIKDRLRAEYGSAQLGTGRMKYHAMTVGDVGLFDEMPSRDRAHEECVDARDSCAWALSHLTPRRQRIFSMRFFDGCTERETADYVGVCEGRISQILREGCERMREILRPEGAQPLVESVQVVDEPLLSM